MNKDQQKKIQEKLGKICDRIEVDEKDLINLVKYMSPKICIDFDETQEKVITEAFPDKESDFAIIDRSALVKMIRYMSPP